MSPKNKSNEIKITRIYEAPVKAVWDAWTDPKQVAQWWGPRGFSITTHSKDLRPGGSWVYTMHGPDGTDYPNKTVYFEVEKYARLVYDHGANDTQPALFRVSVNFSQVKGGTKMEMTMAFTSPEALEHSKQIIKKAGGNGTWDRLAEFLNADSGKDIFVINRSFDVPLEMMYEMWTNPEHFAHWLPPTGFTMQFKSADIRAGGSASYSMTDGKTTLYGRLDYVELRQPDRLVYTQQFCDAEGRVSRHPMAPTWPETMRTVVTLAAEGPQNTRVTIEWEVHGKATAEERATFHSAKSGMAQGWGGSFDKLEAYLARRS